MAHFITRMSLLFGQNRVKQTAAPKYHNHNNKKRKSSFALHRCLLLFIFPLIQFSDTDNCTRPPQFWLFKKLRFSVKTVAKEHLQMPHWGQHAKNKYPNRIFPSNIHIFLFMQSFLKCSNFPQNCLHVY